MLLRRTIKKYFHALLCSIVYNDVCVHYKITKLSIMYLYKCLNT